MANNLLMLTKLDTDTMAFASLLVSIVAALAAIFAAYYANIAAFYAENAATNLAYLEKILPVGVDLVLCGRLSGGHYGSIYRERWFLCADSMYTDRRHSLLHLSDISEKHRGHGGRGEG